MAIFFLNAEFKYPEKIVDEVSLAVTNYTNEAISDLKIKNSFDVIIYPTHIWTEETGGVNGQAMSRGVLQIRIDLRNNKYKIKKLLKTPLKAVVYHECNHIARRQGPGYGENLLEATVSEGLANIYERMRTEDPYISHTDSTPIDLLDIYRQRDKENDAYYDYNAWFLGSDPRYPLFLGNMVGAYVIEKAMKNAPKISISKMTRMPVKKIIGLSKVDL